MAKAQIQCPKCKSYKVRTSKVVAFTLIAVGLATLIFLVGIFFILLGIIIAIQNENACESCGYKWKGNKPVVVME